LRCLRGIDTLTAVGLCSEIGDFERFAHPEQLMSYLGLVPSEHSSGQSRRQGAITKTGSGHSRRLLVEAAWKYRARPRIRKALTDRQAGQPPEAIAVAYSAQQRLHRTWQRLERRNKRRTIIAIAVARELSGFCWGHRPHRITHPTTTHPVGWAGGGPATRGESATTAMSNPPHTGAGYARF
jgi:hypothetical protein